MTDPKTLLEGLSAFRISLSPAAVPSSLITLAVTFGMNKLIRYLQRGKRIGVVSGPIEVGREPGLFQRVLVPWGLSAGFADKVKLGLLQGLFLVFTTLSFLSLPLPFLPYSSFFLALVATIQLGLYAKSLKGRCVAYERGLLIEGAFASFEKLSLEREEDSLVLRFGKARLNLGWAQFETNKRVIRDPSLHIKFDAFRHQQASTAPREQVSTT